MEGSTRERQKFLLAFLMSLSTLTGSSLHQVDPVQLAIRRTLSPEFSVRSDRFHFAFVEHHHLVGIPHG